MMIMYEVISMSNKELDRLKIIEQLAQKLINQRQAANILGLSTRQVKRLVKGYKIHSPKGIVSKKRGMASNRSLPVSKVELAKALIEQN